MTDKILMQQFFYTTNTPHEWSSGPTVRTLNNEYTHIASLEEAKALAEEKATGRIGSRGYTETTWGVSYDYREENWLNYGWHRVEEKSND